MKKITSLLLSAVMVVSTSLSAAAYADKEWTLIKTSIDDKSKAAYSYYEDFSNVGIGQRPGSFSRVSEASNTSVSVVNAIAENGEEKKMLKLDDRNPSGSVSFDIPITQKGDKLIYEVRFKLENPNDSETIPFSMYMMSGGTNIVVATDSPTNPVDYLYYFSLNGVNLYPVAIDLQNGVWYEIELLVDKKAGTFDAQTKTDAFIGKTTKNPGKFDKDLGVSLMPNLASNPAVAFNGVDTIRVATTGKVGEMYIEYIRVKDNATGIEYKGAPPEKIALPYIGNSVILPDEGVINVVYKGKPVLFTIKPFYEDGTVYAPLRSIGSVYGLKNTFADGVYTLTNGVKEVKVSATEITVDGVKLNAPVKVVSGIYCISIPEFAAAMGDKVTFDKDVIIE